MTQRDYYDTLGVSKTASAEEIKRSFRKLAMQYHPDRNPDNKEAETKFKEVNEAYEILKDEQKRAAYDRYGHQAFMGGNSGGNPFGFNFDFGETGGFADIFSSVFSEFMGGGRSSKPSYAKQGADTRYDITITLEEAFAGVEKEITINSSEVCPSCKGHGTKDGEPAPMCPHCQGRGKIHTQKGFFVMEQPCPHCLGSGYLAKDPCENCHGHGTIKKEKNIKIKIPAGIYDGSRIRVAGGGKAGIRGGQNGDLYVFVSILEHSLYERGDNNLYTQVPISICCAALGGTIEIPAINGDKIELKIKAGTQSDEILKVKGQGFSILRSNSRGDLFVKLKVETPVNLTSRQKELLEEFRSISNDNCQPQEKGFLDKIKELFEG